MSVEMVVLRAEPRAKGNSIKTMLIDHDEYAHDPAPAHYFTSEYTNAVELGIIQIVGDTDQLDTTYESV